MAMYSVQKRIHHKEWRMNEATNLHFFVFSMRNTYLPNIASHYLPLKVATTNFCGTAFRVEYTLCMRELRHNTSTSCHCSKLCSRARASAMSTTENVFNPSISLNLFIPCLAVAYQRILRLRAEVLLFVSTRTERKENPSAAENCNRGHVGLKKSPCPRSMLEIFIHASIEQ